ncbi:MAG TPA: DUF2298 domain-containing protein, partial [Anaerolineae bacterium]
ANRTPIIFPLINLLFWGLGLPLGIAAVAGFLYALTQLIQRRRWVAYVIPVVWGGLFFLYQSTQWTKSIRYLMPIYPTLCLFAAVGLVALWRFVAIKLPESPAQPSQSTLTRLVRAAPSILTAIVLLGNLIWALGFNQIYSEPVTRLAASRWVFANIPTAITLHWKEADGTPGHMELPVTKLDLVPGAPWVVQFHIDLKNPRPVSKLEIELNHVQGDGDVDVKLTTPDGATVLQATHALVDNTHTVIPVGFVNLSTQEVYALSLHLQSGAGVHARTNVVANEHWDDAVPQPVDGKDPYGSYYTGLKSSSDGQIQNYAEDIPEKLPNVLNWLDEADYLVMSSNRLYGAIPRLPWRFPMTTEYYRALFNGELGFELAADFHSFIRIGPFEFNDQEMPQFLRHLATTQGTPQGIQVPYPYAEEAFSVYDHPRVLIFRKTAAYSRALAEQILGKYDLTRTIQQTPLAAINTPRGMLFDDSSRAAQQAGGTWSDLFRRDSPFNQSQALAVFTWILLLEVLGVTVFPIIALVLTGRQTSSNPHPLLDGGYSFSKILALLIVAFVAWWLSSTKIAQYTALELWLVIILVALIGIVLFLRNQVRLLEIVRFRWQVMLVSEIVFLIAFGLFLIVRSGNPDLWHPYMGGEKPMDFAFLNSI